MTIRLAREGAYKHIGHAARLQHSNQLGQGLKAGFGMANVLSSRFCPCAPNDERLLPICDGFANLQRADAVFTSAIS